MAVLTLGSRTFAGDRAGIPGGKWFFRKLTDWNSLPDSKSDIVQRPTDHGAFGITRDLRGTIAPSFDGMYVGDSRADALQAQRDLKVDAARGSNVVMSLTDTDGVFTRRVSIRRIDVDDIRGGQVLTFTVYTVAPDPRMYGPTLTAATGLPTSGTGMVFPAVFPADFGTPGDPGQVTLTNAGTADTLPLLAVSGQLDAGFSIVEVATSRETRFERIVPAGSTVYVDTRTGRAYIDSPGSDVSGFLTRTDYPTVPAMQSRTLQFASLGSSSGTPQLVASWASAWW